MVTLRLHDPSLVLLIGAAGAGKSTLAERWFESDEILSSDTLRAAVSGDAADQRASGVVFGIIHRTLARRMAAGQMTVIDATNTRPEHRRPLLLRASRAGVPAIGIVLDLSADEVHARNARRGRQVDPAVVDRHLAAVRQTVDRRVLEIEGFERILVLRTATDVAGLDVVRLTRPRCRRSPPRPGRSRPRDRG